MGDPRRSATSHCAPVAWLTDDDLRLVRRRRLPGRRRRRTRAAAGVGRRGGRPVIRDTPPHEGDRGPGQSTSSRRAAGCRGARTCPALPALEIAEELVGPNTLDHAFDHIQVATTVSPWSHVPGGPHIDGHRPSQDSPGSFTMLAGVLLTDQHDPQSGNLWVWPGSHLDHERLFQERGDQGAAPDERPRHAPPAGSEARAARRRHGRPRRPRPRALPARAQQGRQHRRPRPANRLHRLAVPGHPRWWEQTFLDAWTEYPAVRDRRRTGGAGNRAAARA